MKVTILQTDIAWNAPDANALRAEQLMKSAEGSDLYVLPEMWSTGFATQPEGIAETDHRSYEWMQSIAQEKNAAVCGSVAIRDTDSTYRNRMFFVKPDGSSQFYDKRHLFAFGGENQHYRRGERRVVVEYMGWRLLLLVCYDLRFPVWSRNMGDYDAMIYVANWPEARQEVWNALLRARAIENQCYVIGVNRVGNDPAARYVGGSVVIDAKGKTLAECPAAEETTITADLSLDDLQRFRDKFRVLDDRDGFTMQ